MSETFHVLRAHCHTTNRVPLARLGAEPVRGHCQQPLCAGRPIELTREGLAARFAIRAIPTLIAFKNGREVARRSGASDLRGLMQWVEDNV